jgi:group I intron endonuclease
MWVYKLTNTVNGKVYVGKTSNLEQRWKDHRRGKSCGAIAKALRKHGADAFDFSILEAGIESEAELARLEIEWIAKLQSHGSLGGYNMTLGGEGSRLTPEMIEARRVAGQWPTGPKHSEAQKERWSALRRGRPVSDAQRLAISKAHRGKPKSAEHRLKIAAAATGRVLSPETRAKIGAARQAFEAERRAAQ